HPAYTMRPSRSTVRTLLNRHLEVHHQHEGVSRYPDFRDFELPDLPFILRLVPRAFQQKLRVPLQRIFEIASQAALHGRANLPDVVAVFPVAGNLYAGQSDRAGPIDRQGRDHGIECIADAHALADQVEGGPSAEMSTYAQTAVFAAHLRLLQVSE